MTHVDDLSRSLLAFDQATTLVVVVEMSEASWLVAGLVPGVDRQPMKKVAPDPTELLRLLERWRAEAMRAGRSIGRIALAYEAGRDGFWLARWLRARGVEGHVIHSMSVAVSREHRRAKTDRAGHGDADARVSGLAARRARALRDGRGPDDRGRGCQASEP
jgi:transposase